MRRTPTGMLATALLLGSANARPSFESPPPDKSGYTLVNPTPRELMRDMSTDRPDATESAYTVDAGHVQVEMSFLQFTRDDTGPRVDSYVYAPFNVRLGLLNNAEIQMLFDPFVRVQDRGAPDASGVGDLTLRFKMNLWGNDAGDTALAIMPFVKLPTGDRDISNGNAEPGVIVAFGASLPGEFNLGLMGEFDAVRNAADDGFEFEFLHTATIGRTLFGPLGAYIEYVGVASSDAASDYRASFSTGLTVSLSADVQLDAGVVLGLTDAADDLSVFTGISVRF